MLMIDNDRHHIEDEHFPQRSSLENQGDSSTFHFLATNQEASAQERSGTEVLELAEATTRRVLALCYQIFGKQQ